MRASGVGSDPYKSPLATSGRLKQHSTPQVILGHSPHCRRCRRAGTARALRARDDARTRRQTPLLCHMRRRAGLVTAACHGVLALGRSAPLLIRCSQVRRSRCAELCIVSLGALRGRSGSTPRCRAPGDGRRPAPHGAATWVLVSLCRGLVLLPSFSAATGSELRGALVSPAALLAAACSSPLAAVSRPPTVTPL